jgi:Fic family protein
MLYATPEPTADLAAKLAELDGLRKRLASQSAGDTLWLGVLRRSVEAEAVASSVWIEGFRVSEEDALALVTGAEEPGVDTNRLAVACYGRAMRRVRVMAGDPGFRWLDRVILDLHFDACEFQPDKGPGRWREGAIWVTDGRGGVAYEGPDAADVPDLMDEVVEWLEAGDLDAHPVVRAAMAHLHVVRVHPFRDGNGRVSRIVQSLVLGRDGVAISPELASIEEYLRENTAAYYAALQTTGESYEPARDGVAWVEFCIDAHLVQARRRLGQIEAAGARWAALEQAVELHDWPDRLVIALEQALMSGAERAGYTTEADVSTATATNDLRQLVAAGLIERTGRGRGTAYVATGRLRELVGENAS